MKKVFRKLVKGKRETKSDSHEDGIHSTESPLNSMQQNKLYQMSHAGGYHIDLNNEDTNLTKLHCASWLGQVDVIKKCLKKTNINTVDSHKRTSLHLAVAQCYLHIVQLLLDHGADSEIMDDDGLTPFLKAVEIGNMDLVQSFINHNVRLNVTDNKGNTALHLAVLYGFRNITALLLHKGAARDIINQNGDTPLHVATQNEYLEVVDLLLKNGVNFNAVDSENRTPLMIAMKTKNIPLLKLFIRYGAYETLNEDYIDQAIKNFISTNDCSVIDAVIKKNVTEEGSIHSESAATNDIWNDSQNYSLNTMSDANDEKMKNSLVMKDEDSQMSMQSCIIPPALKPPRSWDIIQSGVINNQQVLDLNDEVETERKAKRHSRTTTSGFEDISDSVDGTLGRDDTLKGNDEIWESNSKFQKIRTSLEKLNVSNNKIGLFGKFSECNTNDIKTDATSSKNIPDISGNLINKSKSMDIGRNRSQADKESRRIRCKSLTTTTNMKLELNKDLGISNYTDKKRMSSQLETYDKALEELSLNAVSATNGFGNFRRNRDNIGFTGINGNLKSPMSEDITNQNKSPIDTFLKESGINFNANSDISEHNQKSLKNETISSEDMIGNNETSFEMLEINVEDSLCDKHLSKKRQQLLNMRNVSDKSPVSGNDDDSDDSSTDEDPPFWRSSGQGGYFCKQDTVIKLVSDADGECRLPSDQSKQYPKSSSSSDGDEKQGSKNSFILEAPHNIVWEHLKQVTKDKGELENVTMSLKETAEKLKYDLSNSREAVINREDSLAVLTKQLILVDDKYTRTMEQINEFQHCMKNLEQEVIHLTEVCQKANKNNHYLLQQIKNLVENSKLADKEKELLMNQNISDIHKLQTDVLSWQQKHDFITHQLDHERVGNNHLCRAKHDLQQVVDEIEQLRRQCDNETAGSKNQDGYSELKLEFDKLNEKLKLCTSKMICDGNANQEELNKSENRLFDELKEVKSILQSKFDELHQQELERMKSEARMASEFENSKQKYLIEISRLNSLLKLKENEGQKFKEEYDTLTEKIEKCKDDKRRQLIEKSYSLSWDQNSGLSPPPPPPSPLLPPSENPSSSSIPAFALSTIQKLAENAEVEQ